VANTNHRREPTTIDLLLKKMEELEKQLNDLKEKKVEYNFTIHELHVSDPVLKEVSFNLDSLDIKQLSGSLNMGNNFSPKVEQKNNEEKKSHVKSNMPKGENRPKKKMEPKYPVEDDIMIIINEKKKPYFVVSNS
jgi:hypothetical protein